MTGGLPPLPASSSLSSRLPRRRPRPSPSVPTFQAPTVIVTAQKEPADAQTLPVSVTAVRGETLSNAGITVIREAAIYAPNTYFTDFTARKLSNPRFRGIGSSPNNPSITTYLDGVPQLNANSSSLDLIDVEQVEFVRGPQSALFGRNTLGGVITVVERAPLAVGLERRGQRAGVELRRT